MGVVGEEKDREKQPPIREEGGKNKRREEQTKKLGRTDKER